jgi:hypothetical protein
LNQKVNIITVKSHKILNPNPKQDGFILKKVEIYSSVKAKKRNEMRRTAESQPKNTFEAIAERSQQIKERIKQKFQENFSDEKLQENKEFIDGVLSYRVESVAPLNVSDLER